MLLVENELNRRAAPDSRSAGSPISPVLAFAVYPLLCLLPSRQKCHAVLLEESMFPVAELYMVAAAGYSLVYLLGGGGIFGAIVIFIIAKMMGK
jgi:hypothetical protein